MEYSIQHGRSVPDFRSFANGEIIYILILPQSHRYNKDKKDDPPDAFHDYFEYKGSDKGVCAIYYGRPNEKRELQLVTRAIAHEIAEACTNPFPYKEAFICVEDKERGIERS